MLTRIGSPRQASIRQAVTPRRAFWLAESHCASSTVGEARPTGRRSDASTEDQRQHDATVSPGKHRHQQPDARRGRRDEQDHVADPERMATDERIERQRRAAGQRQREPPVLTVLAHQSLQEGSSTAPTAPPGHGPATHLSQPPADLDQRRDRHPVRGVVGLVEPPGDEPLPNGGLAQHEEQAQRPRGQTPTRSTAGQVTRPMPATRLRARGVNHATAIAATVIGQASYRVRHARASARPARPRGWRRQRGDGRARRAGPTVRGGPSLRTGLADDAGRARCPNAATPFRREAVQQGDATDRQAEQRRLGHRRGLQVEHVRVGWRARSPPRGLPGRNAGGGSGRARSGRRPRRRELSIEMATPEAPVR